MTSLGRWCVLVVALGGGALLAAEPAHDHASMATAPADTTGGLYTAADLMFLTHMSVHHEQALRLCELVPGRSTRPEFLRFARYVNDAQATEIRMMQGLLRLAADRGATIPEQHLDGDPPMAGMLSKAEMVAIAAAKGLEFERLWLTGMIRHHQGGVDMATAQQQAQFRNGNQPWGVDVMVDEMLTVQRGEIHQMERWLAEWR